MSNKDKTILELEVLMLKSAVKQEAISLSLKQFENYTYNESMPPNMSVEKQRDFEKAFCKLKKMHENIVAAYKTLCFVLDRQNSLLTMIIKYIRQDKSIKKWKKRMNTFYFDVSCEIDYHLAETEECLCYLDVRGSTKPVTAIAEYEELKKHLLNFEEIHKIRVADADFDRHYYF